MSQPIQHKLDGGVRFFIMTPMIKKLNDAVRRWTLCGLIGAVIIGESRAGKSFAIKNIGETLTVHNNEKIKVIVISIGDRDKKTIRSVFERIARKLNILVKNHDSADKLATPIKMRLSDECMLNSTRQVIVIVDEAHLLTIDQLSAFAEIYNDLSEINMNCIFYFVVDENMFPPLARELLKKENSYIRERFFDHIHHFYGLRDAGDVKSCLSQYDTYLINDSDELTATEYYCPVLYRSGWRLSDIAEPLWHLYYENYMKPLKHDSWKMNKFVRTVNILLMDYLSSYENELNPEIIQGSILRSLEAAQINPSLQEFTKPC